MNHFRFQIFYDLIISFEIESDSYLEMKRFSDHDPDLFLNQHKICDPTVYYMTKFEVKKNFFCPKIPGNKRKNLIRHYGFQH